MKPVIIWLAVGLILLAVIVKSNGFFVLPAKTVGGGASAALPDNLPSVVVSPVVEPVSPEPAVTEVAAVDIRKDEVAGTGEPVPLKDIKIEPAAAKIEVAPASQTKKSDIPAPAVPAAAVNVSFMKTSGNPLLEKLAEYEDCCGGAIAKMMVFTYFPGTKAEAANMADDMAQELDDFYTAGVMPIVAVEPVNGAGQPYNFAAIAAGSYDAALRAYFSALLAKGMNAARLGLWMPLPEPNLDEWGDDNHKPADFGAAYNRYAQILREYFPAARLTVLLDNETYNDSRGETELVSLLPWVAAIDRSLVDSFGFQGYPWVAPANDGDEKDLDAASFLNANRALEAAKGLGVDSVWFSTGTFSEMFSHDAAATVYIDASRRAEVLSGILAQAKIARAAGYKVMLCIFAEDKSDTDEATNFSYWGSEMSGPGVKIFNDFSAAALKEGIPLAIYDSIKD